MKENFFNNCLKKGHPYDTINTIWEQIESFANFAFSKGHSASYAVESYQALFLKAYYPLEYMVATLNNGGGFYRTELYVHEARLHGAEIIPPCVNNSNALSNIKDKNIYLGFNMIAAFENNSTNELIRERELNGEFKDLYDFIKRVQISLDQLRLLIRVGAFRFTGINKKKLLWEAHMMVNPVKKDRKNELFDLEPKKYSLPKLNDSWIDDAFDEIELLGFSLCSPLKLLKEKISNTLIAKDLKNHINKTVEIIGYLVNIKTTWTGKGDRMNFGTFLDLEGMWIDTVHFPPAAKAFPFQGPGCYRIKGKVMEEFDHITIEVVELKRLVTLNREDYVEEAKLA